MWKVANLKVLEKKRGYGLLNDHGGFMMEEAPDTFYIDNAEGGYCGVCRKESKPPMLAYEPEDGAYATSICKNCLDNITKQIDTLKVVHGRWL